MAQTRIIEILDDLDGTPEATPHTFSLDGVTYEIDLSESNFQRLADGLGPFITAARKTKGQGGRSSTKQQATREDLSRIRSWANSNGYQVAPRGRVRQEIVEAYRAAQS